MEVYRIRRESLIPQAEKVAYEQLGPKPIRGPDQKMNCHEKELDAWNNAWNKVFHSEMERLWKLKEKQPIEYCHCSKCGNKHLKV